MNVREEFEKAFERSMNPGRLSGMSDPTPIQTALWAAKWMGERCANRLLVSKSNTISSAVDEIRQLASELQ